MLVLTIDDQWLIVPNYTCDIWRFDENPYRLQYVDIFNDLTCQRKWKGIYSIWVDEMLHYFRRERFGINKSTGSLNMSLYLT